MIKKTILLLTLSIILSKKLDQESISLAANLIKQAASDYELSDELTQDLSHFKNGKNIGETLVFTTDSEFHEHMISVDLQAKKESLLMNLYDAKSNDIKKEIMFDESILSIETEPLRELIHRMVEKPGAKVTFNMIEDIMRDIFPLFKSLNYKYVVDSNIVKILFSSEESTVALFEIFIIKNVTEEETQRADFKMRVKLSMSVGQNDITNDEFEFSMFDSESAKGISKTIKSFGSVKNYFNNLSQATQIFTDVLHSQGFRNIKKSHVEYNETKERYETVVYMKFNKAHHIAKLFYVPGDSDIGSYQLKVFKDDTNRITDLKEDSKTMAELNFTRQLGKDLHNLFADLKLKELQVLYHTEVLDKFEEVYERTYKKTYPDYELSREEKEFSRKTYLKFINKQRSVKGVITSDNKANNQLCKFAYDENETKIIIKFSVPKFNIESKYEFDWNDYNYETVADYVETIVTSSYAYEEAIME